MVKDWIAIAFERLLGFFTYDNMLWFFVIIPTPLIYGFYLCNCIFTHQFKHVFLGVQVPTTYVLVDEFHYALVSGGLKFIEISKKKKCINHCNSSTVRLHSSFHYTEMSRQNQLEIMQKSRG